MEKDVPGAGPHADMADNTQIAPIRLVLAMSALLAVIVEHAVSGAALPVALPVLSCYATLCGASCADAQGRQRWTSGTLMHRVDAALFVALAATASDADAYLDIIPPVFLMFAIMVASLRHGLQEGARLTVLAVILYCVVTVAVHAQVAPAGLALRAAVLLAFGGAIAHLGERHLQAVRREALLRDLHQVANPRFGVDRTMTAALERIRDFFMADSCIALLEDTDSGGHAIRAVRAHGEQLAHAEPVGDELAGLLLPEPRSHLLSYVRPRRWMAHERGPLHELAALLGAGSFIGAPLVFARGRGRIYVSARGRHLRRRDALFLARIAEELRAIDRIDLLDRLASDSAACARKKIALDLHDTAIQSYIGLQLGLTALCRRAAPSNPLSADLGKLAAMAGDVAVQLRETIRRGAGEPAGDEPVCLAALRRLARQARAAYGVEVSIDVDGALAFGDRLAAEVLQIVREGISNICRHTTARSATVLLHCGAELLRIEIGNGHGAGPPPPFRPRSISERAATLGGTTFVREGRFHETIVCVEIPL
ncbi:MAG: GAF domain-containing sensor histidine kinase [Xanthobacteraceae bacterium]